MSVDPNIGLEFLLTEIEAGLVFAKIAHDAPSANDEKFIRNRQHAEKAYQTVLRFKPDVIIPPASQQRFTEELSRLESALRDLDEAAK